MAQTWPDSSPSTVAPNSEVTQDQVVDSARMVRGSLRPGTRWLNSWVSAAEGKLISEWDAPNPDAIRAAREPSKDLFPIEAIYEVERIDPQ